MPEPVQYRGMSLLIPDNDSEWKEYFAHARQHKLMLRACNAWWSDTRCCAPATGSRGASPSSR